MAAQECNSNRTEQCKSPQQPNASKVMHFTLCRKKLLSLIVALFLFLLSSGNRAGERRDDTRRLGISSLPPPPPPEQNDPQKEKDFGKKLSNRCLHMHALTLELMDDCGFSMMSQINFWYFASFPFPKSSCSRCRKDSASLRISS